MNFSEALTHLKNGSKVRLSTWDIKEHLYLNQGSIFKKSLMNVDEKVFEVDYFYTSEMGAPELLEKSWELV